MEQGPWRATARDEGSAGKDGDSRASPREREPKLPNVGVDGSQGKSVDENSLAPKNLDERCSGSKGGEKVGEFQRRA